MYLLYYKIEIDYTSKKYKQKYPTATSCINMNELLFTTNPQAEIDYKEASAKIVIKIPI